MMTTPKLMAFDLDGTLAKSKQPTTPDVGEHLKRLLDAMPVAVMSGGSWRQFDVQLLPALPQDTNLEQLYLFPVSSAQCFRFIEGAWKTVYDHAFSDAEKERVMQVLTNALKETGLDKEPEKVWGSRIEDRVAQITFSGLGQEAPWEAKAAWDPDKVIRTPLANLLTERLNGFSVRMNAATSIDITRDGLTKAHGLRKLSEMAGISIEDMLYVGDALGPGGNDEIVKETGVPTRQTAGPEETARIIDEVLGEVA